VLSLSEMEAVSSTGGRLFSVSSADQERVRIFEADDGYSFYWPTARRPFDRITADLSRAALSPPGRPRSAQVYLAFNDGSYAELLPRLPFSHIQLKRVSGKRTPVFIRLDTPMVRLAVDLPVEEASEGLFAIQAPRPLATATLRLVPNLFARTSALPIAEALAVARALRSELAPLIRQHLVAPSGTATR
jgi:hypothetical protein